VVGDLAVSDPRYVDTLEMNFVVSWSDAKKRSFMRAVICLVCCHPVAIGQLPMDLRVNVGKCVANIAVELSHAHFLGRHVWLRCVIDKVVGEKFVETSKFPRFCTSSVLCRTTAFAASDAFMIPIRVPSLWSDRDISRVSSFAVAEPMPLLPR